MIINKSVMVKVCVVILRLYIFLNWYVYREWLITLFEFEFILQFSSYFWTNPIGGLKEKFCCQHPYFCWYLFKDKVWHDLVELRCRQTMANLQVKISNKFILLNKMLTEQQNLQEADEERNRTWQPWQDNAQTKEEHRLYREADETKWQTPEVVRLESGAMRAERGGGQNTEIPQSQVKVDFFFFTIDSLRNKMNNIIFFWRMFCSKM